MHQRSAVAGRYCRTCKISVPPHTDLASRIAAAKKAGTTYYVRPVDNFTEVKDNSSDLRLQCRSNILNSVPSIQSILSDAQELIKKHHNITGEVEFTIKCN